MNALRTALHQGNIGWWNTLLNLAFCLAVVLICISGVTMWWARRPQGQVGVPRYARTFRAPVAILLIGGLVVCLAFPLTGIAVLAFALVELLLPKSLKEAGA